MSNTTDLYRFFDTNNRLLYVGISFSAVARASQHRAEKDWWPDVARMEVEHFPTRAAADDAETRAIRTENPIHNIAKRSGDLGQPVMAPWRCELCRHDVGHSKESGYVQVDDCDEWHVYCWRCDNGDERYWICASRIKDRKDLERWTRHLQEKNWFDISSWEQVARQHSNIRDASEIVMRTFRDRRRTA